MPNPFFAIFLLIIIFCFLLAISFLLNLLYHYKENYNQVNEENEEKNQNKNKTNHFRYPKRKNSENHKKPDIALKNKILINTNTKNWWNN